MEKKLVATDGVYEHGINNVIRQRMDEGLLAYCPLLPAWLLTIGHVVTETAM